MVASNEQISCAVSKVKGLSFTEILERGHYNQHMLQDENIANEWK